MEIILAIAITATAIFGAGQVVQRFLARRIQKLVLAGSRFHLAQSSSGAIELRSGVRQEPLTQREASYLAPGLRALVSQLHWNPLLGLKLLSKNQGIVEAQGIEDAFLKAAVDSQRQELILLAEDRGIKGRTVELIMGVETDEDFGKLRTAISAANYGDDLPDSLAKELQLKDHRMLEPLVLWSSSSTPKKSTAALPAPQITTNKNGVVEETIPSLPGYTFRISVTDRGGEFEKIVVKICRGKEVLGSDDAYTEIYARDLDGKVLQMKRRLISRTKSLAKMGI